MLPVDSVKFNLLPDNAGLPGADDEYAVISIGFKFNFDGKVYDSVYVSTNGWCALIDPTYSSLNYDIVVGDILTGWNPYRNDGIKDVFGADHVLLAPWFDDLRSIYRNPGDSGVVSYLSALYSPASVPSDIVEQMMTGKAPYFDGLDPTSGGVMFFTGTDRIGRFLNVRWKSFANYLRPNNIVFFDVTIRENGTIVFGYSPKIVRAQESANSVGATVGIFAYGGSGGSPRFRDFSTLLRRGSDSRAYHPNGGVVYDASYTDTDTAYMSPPAVHYGVSLDVSQHWPGQTEVGASFIFAPPARRKSITRLTPLAKTSRDFISKDVSYFDDRKTVNFVSEEVEYPSMLPTRLRTLRGLGVDEYGCTGLFASGSITTTRTVSAGLYEDVLISERDGEKR